MLTKTDIKKLPAWQQHRRTNMILSEFSKFLQEHNDEIIKNKTTLSLLTAWILSVLEKPAQTNVEKVIHQEIDFY